MRVLVLLLLFSTSALADWSIVTLNKSWHYSSKDYNETHNGIGLQYKDYGYINYTNSHNDSSNLIYWQPHKHIILGAADGYKKHQDKNMVLGGLVADWKIFRFIFTPAVSAIGLKIPIH